MNGIAPAKAGALRAYLSALGFQVNSGQAVFRQYFNEVGWRYYFTVSSVLRGRNGISRGRVGDEILIAFRANGDVGHRQPFAKLDQPSLGQKILLRRALKWTDWL
jgi:hypothetical protein